MDNCAKLVQSDYRVLTVEPHIRQLTAHWVASTVESLALDAASSRAHVVCILDRHDAMANAKKAIAAYASLVEAVGLLAARYATLERLRLLDVSAYTVRMQYFAAAECKAFLPISKHY